MKKIISLLLTLSMVLGGILCAAAEEAPVPMPMGEPMELPDYLDVYNEREFLAEAEGVTLQVLHQFNESTGGDAADAWIYKYITEKTGIQFEFEMMGQSAAAERVSLLFAADMVPDIMINMSLNTSQLVKYGMQEGQLLAFNDYITPEIMPALYYWFETYPEYKALCTAPDGNIYSLPRLFSYQDTNQTNNIGFINEVWLEEAGLPMPRSLDELTEALLAYKEQNPDYVPLGGSAKSYDPRHWLINAFGFVVSGKANFNGYEPALLDGEPVIPCMEDVFYYYLELLREYYVAGLINEDFFTRDADAVRAQFATEQVLFMADRPSYFITETTDKSSYAAVSPLTSEYNDTAKWAANSAVVVGGVMVSSETEHPELIAKMLDWYYTDKGSIYMWNGPMVGEDTLSLVHGWEWDEERQGFINRDTMTVENGGTGKYAEVSMMYYGHETNPNSNMRFGSRMGPMAYTHDLRSTVSNTQQLLWGFEPTYTEITTYHYVTTLENVGPHTVDGYPRITYLTDEDSTRATELKAAISSYVEAEIAKFVVGTRALTPEEFNSFRAGLEKLNIQEYKDIYAKVYEDYLSALQ